MSALFVPFVFELRKRGVKVGTTEAVTLAAAVKKGLHRNSLDGFYHVARALLIHREADLYACDQAFLACFKGADAEGTKALSELLQWLDETKKKRDLSDEERAMLQALDEKELRRLFEERMAEQKERHDGGNRWIGTGGSSPFGAGGEHPTGLRVGPNGGNRSAMGVVDPRKYAGYRADLVLDVRSVEAALRRLRSIAREGAIDELDIEETIAKTAKNGGELEIALRAPRKSNTRVLLLMDVGGSMDPFAHAVSLLFSAAKKASNIRSLKSYYFHNCIYGHLFEAEPPKEGPILDPFQKPVRVQEVLDACSPRWKVVLVGDAAMHPAELLGRGDYGFYADARERDESLRGVEWLEKISKHFERSAWLNPDPEPYWKGGTAEAIGRIFPMYRLTLDGIGEAVKDLVRGEATKR